MIITILFFFLQKIISWKESALLELKHLESSLSDQKNEIENGVENLEGKKKDSDYERKEILQKTMLAGASYLTRLYLSDINSLDLTARRKEPSIL